MTRKKSWLALALIFACHGQAPVAAESNYMQQGQLSFQQHDYERALQYFSAALKQNPSSGVAHYYLGSIYVQWNQLDKATHEYAEAARLEPRSVAGDYSRKALAALKLRQHPSETPVSHPDSEADAGPDADTSQSISRLSSQTDERESDLKKECDARVARIMKDAEDEAARITKEMNERIAANGSPVYRQSRYGTTTEILYDPAPLNEEVKTECTARIEKLKTEARYKADALIKSFKARESAIDSTASRLEQTYSQGGRIDASTSLVPKGTTIYTHLYQTTDTPSGLPVPVRAGEAKHLNGGVPKQK